MRNHVLHSPLLLLNLSKIRNWPENARVGQTAQLAAHLAHSTTAATTTNRNHQFLLHMKKKTSTSYKAAEVPPLHSIIYHS